VPIEGKADVRDGRLITVEYEVRDSDGTALTSSSETGPMRFIFGGGQVLPAIERALAGREPGESVVQAVSKTEGFGERDESRVMEVPRDRLEPGVVVGDTVIAQDEMGRQMPLIVLELDENTARLDANHPFA